MILQGHHNGTLAETILIFNIQYSSRVVVSTPCVPDRADNDRYEKSNLNPHQREIFCCPGKYSKNVGTSTTVKKILIILSLLKSTAT
jgi:hypothetical protein